MRFEKSNEMIQNCNTIMNNHLQIIGPQLTEGGLQFIKSSWAMKRRDSMIITRFVHVISVMYFWLNFEATQKTT